MLNLDQLMNIRFLQKQDHGVREITRFTAHPPNTVRKFLFAKRPPIAPPRHHTSKLGPLKNYLTERGQEHGLWAVRPTENVKARGFTGSVKIMRLCLAEGASSFYSRGEGERGANLAGR
jgi:hypothetical protein